MCATSYTHPSSNIGHRTSGSARDLLNHLLRERKADAAVGIVQAALRQGEATAASAVFAVQRLQRFGALVGREFGQVDAGNFVRLRGVVEALLVFVLGVK